MGMFDDIRVKYKLPLPKEMGELSEHHFNLGYKYQTKSLENVLNVYEIREDGTLWIERSDGEYVPGNPNGKSFLSRLGHIKTIREWWEKVDYTGSILFYSSVPGSENRDEFKNDYWIEYDALFVDGKVERIKVSKFEFELNDERKRMDSIFNKRTELQREFNKTWFNRYFYKHYMYILNKGFRLMNRFSNFVSSFCHYYIKIERWLDFIGRRIDKESGIVEVENKRKNYN